MKALRAPPFRDGELRKIICLIFALLLASAQTSTADSEKQAFLRIKDLAEKRHEVGVKKAAAGFFKSFPQSRLIADVRFMLAESESDPEEAVAKYRTLIDKYRNFPNREEAQLAICRIYELLGSWELLQKEALAALKRFPESGYADTFRLFYCEALLSVNQYDDGHIAANDIIKHSKEYDTLAKAMLFAAQADKNKTGYSRSYIYDLRELIADYGAHYSHPAVLLLLGDFYEKTGEAGKALGVYNDLRKLYPKAPETAIMTKRRTALEQRGVRPLAYKPDQKTIDLSPKIDLSFREENLDEEIGNIYYSVAVGPFKEKNEAADILPILKGFGTVKSFIRNRGFFHYIGSYKTVDEAIACKIRLAEEYGINGNLVRFSTEGNKSYIYGEEM